MAGRFLDSSAVAKSLASRWSKFKVVALSSEHSEKTGELIERYGATQGLGTLDSLQLAVALGLYHGGAIDNFVVADKVPCKVAAIEGIQVTNPESVIPLFGGGKRLVIHPHVHAEV